MNKDSKDISLLGEGTLRGFFSVKLAYGLLTNQGSGPGNAAFSMLWKVKALPKVLCTAWKILLDKIPTSQNLVTRGVVVNSPLCVFCNQSVESTQNLFLDCGYAYRVLMFCYRWIGVLGAQNKDICNHFLNFHLPNLSEKQNLVWKGVWAAITRCIWSTKIM